MVGAIMSSSRSGIVIHEIHFVGRKSTTETVMLSIHPFNAHIPGAIPVLMKPKNSGGK